MKISALPRHDGYIHRWHIQLGPNSSVLRMETDPIAVYQDKLISLDLIEDLGYLGPDPTAVVGIEVVDNHDGSKPYEGSRSYPLIFAIAQSQD